MNNKLLTIAAAGLSLTACHRPVPEAAQAPPSTVQQAAQAQPPEQADPQPEEPADTSPGIAVGKSAPAFALEDQAGKQRTLAEFTEQGTVALVFFRSADW